MTARSILFFIPNFNGGGAERALLNLLDAWPPDLRQRWQPRLVVRQPTGPLRPLLPDWVDLISLDLPRSGRVASTLTVPRLAVVLRQVRPAALITFLSLPAVALAAKAAAVNTKLIASVQNPPRATAADATSARHVRGRLAQRLNHWAFNQCHHLLPIAPGIAAQLTTDYALPPSRLTLLPNPINLRAITAAAQQPVNYPAPNSRPRILTAGRLVPQKRHDILIRAFAIVRQHLNASLTILGEGAEQAELQALAADLNLTDHIHFAGFQPNIWQWMGAADLFALTSDYEGFGNVIVEAMAAGLPVVATRAPFGPEYILADSGHGRLVPPRDPAAVAHSLLELWHNPAQRQALQAGGRQRAADFDIAPIFAHFWHTLEPILCA